MKNIYYWILSLFQKYPTLGGIPRSPKFREVCCALFIYLKKECQWCGSRFFIQVHHFEETYHQNPKRELDPTNLVPLCRKCHLEHGHRGSFQSFETNYSQRLEDRVHRPRWNGKEWLPSEGKVVKYKLTQEELDEWNKKFNTKWAFVYAEGAGGGLG